MTNIERESQIDKQIERQIYKEIEIDSPKRDKNIKKKQSSASSKSQSE